MVATSSQAPQGRAPGQVKEFEAERQPDLSAEAFLIGLGSSHLDDQAVSVKRRGRRRRARPNSLRRKAPAKPTSSQRPIARPY